MKFQKMEPGKALFPIFRFSLHIQSSSIYCESNRMTSERRWPHVIWYIKKHFAYFFKYPTVLLFSHIIGINAERLILYLPIFSVAIKYL